MGPLSSLLGAESVDRVDLRGAPAWDGAGENRHSDQRDGGGQQRDCIEWGHVIEQARKTVAGNNSASEPESYYRQSQIESLMCNEPQNIRAGGSQRKANTDFLRSLDDQVGDDSVDADDGEDDSEGGEGREQAGGEAAVRRLLLDELGHGLGFSERQARVDLMQLCGDFGDERVWRERGADHQVLEAEVNDGHLAEEGNELLHEREGQAQRLGVSHNPDDDGLSALIAHPGIGDAESGGRSDFNAAADGVFRVKVAAGEGLVDDGDDGSGLGVGFGEVAASDQRNAGGFEVVGVDDSKVGGGKVVEARAARPSMEKCMAQRASGG